MDPCAGSRHLIKPVMKNYLPILKWVPVHGDLIELSLTSLLSVIRSQAY